MIWLEAFYLAIATTIFFFVFIEGANDPFAVRVFGAAFAAIVWPAVLILAAMFRVSDWLEGRGE